jgi:hypothetical protein
MAASHKEKLSPKYRIIVQNTEHELAARGAAPVQEERKAEHMFNRLNTRIAEGKNSPMVCKFLDSLSANSHSLLMLLRRACYLFEGMDLRKCAFEPVGLRIAFPIGRPVFSRIHGGKD